MLKTRVGVIRGGVGVEYDVSLKTGSNVLKNIPRDKYEVFDVLITKDGQWHFDGLPVRSKKIGSRIDVMFNALHGEYGEDGKIQRELELFGIPYTGSKVFASVIAMNKALAKYYFKQVGLMTPECSIIKNGNNVYESVRLACKKLFAPYIVKPLSSGSSVGVSVATDFDSLYSAVKKLLMQYPIVLVEEHIDGREITCSVVDSMTSSNAYALLPVEITVPSAVKFFGYEEKYNGNTIEICPANLFSSSTKKIQDYAVKAHNALGMRHYSRTDFILSDRGLYVLETNSLPGLTTKSLLPKSLKTAGLQFPEFLDYVLTLALGGK